jgi:hypothetical protein
MGSRSVRPGIVVVAMTGLLLPGSSGQAFERYEYFCGPHGTSITYHLVPAAFWTTERIRELDLAIADWTVRRRVDGSPIYTFVRTASSGAEFSITTSGDPGSISCKPDRSGVQGVYVDIGHSTEDAIDANGSTFRGTLAHEIGHALGFSHNGLYEAFQAGPTTMSGCYANPTPVGGVLSSDDDAQLQYHVGADAAGDPAITANPSFEYGNFSQNLLLWGRAPGTLTTHVAGGSAGQRYGRIYWDQPAELGQIFNTQRINFHTSVTARLSVRTSAVAVGGATVYLQTRAVSYFAGCDGPAHWSSGVGYDYDAPSYPLGTGFVTRRNQGCAIASVWTPCETTSYAQSGYQGMDARLIVNSNRQTATGDPVPIDIDNVRLTMPHP